MTLRADGVDALGDQAADQLDLPVLPGHRDRHGRELVGGIFWFNYPGGSGLTNGAVFGKIAGASAAGAALKR